jgi:hypothetical protein
MCFAGHFKFCLSTVAGVFAPQGLS